MVEPRKELHWKVQASLEETKVDTIQMLQGPSRAQGVQVPHS